MKSLCNIRVFGSDNTYGYRCDGILCPHVRIVRGLLSAALTSRDLSLDDGCMGRSHSHKSLRCLVVTNLSQNGTSRYPKTIMEK